MASLPLSASFLPTASAWPGSRPGASNWRNAGVAHRVRGGDVSSDDTVMATAASRPAEAEPVIESEPVAMPPFNCLEAMAVQLGRTDPLPFLDQDGRLARLARLLFGAKPPNRLANAHLEALRVVVMAMRRPGRLPQDAIDAALAGGITQDQLDRLAAELRPSRPL